MWFRRKETEWWEVGHWVGVVGGKEYWRPIQWTGARYPERPVFVRDDDFDA